jgi:peptidoglycan/LPS O-acetylase OafA/YrhL
MLGIMFLLLSAADGKTNRFTRVLEVYGRVPMYYYLWHIFLIHTAMFIVVFAQGYGPGDLVWLAVVLIEYPLCLHWSGYRAAHREKVWLRYL